MMGGQFFAMLFQAAYFVLLGRAMGSSQYGAFVGVASFLSVVGQFSTLGMDLILIRDVSRDRDSFSAMWGVSLEIALLGFVGVTGIALLAGKFFLAPDLYWLIPAIAVSDCLFAKVALLASKAFQSVGQFAYSAQVIALTNFARAVAAGLLYAYSVKMHVMATARVWTHIYWVSSLAAAIVGFLMVTWRIGRPKWERIRWSEVWEGLGFSVSSSSISVYNDLDKTMLVSFGQEHAAGIYAAAYRIIDVASTPIYSVYAAAFPSFFQEGAKSIRSALELAIRLSRKTVVYSLVAAAVMALGASLLPSILGGSFHASVSALRWLCLLPLIRCFHYAAGTTITGSVSQWYRTVQQIAVAILNFLLNLYLIPRYSWQGAAAASLLSDGALAALNWIVVIYLMRRQERERAFLA
jgi:O-antigen/teichoic acid export membrane protein